MIDPRHVMENLDLLYGALDDPEQWYGWMRHTSDLLRSDGGCVVVTSRLGENVTAIPQNRQRTPIMIQNALTAAEIEAYAQFAPIDWQREKLKSLRPGQAAALSSLPKPAPSEYRETRFFQEFATHTCLRNFLGGVFMDDEHWLGNLGFFRHRLDVAYLPEECAFASRLNAHTHRVLVQSEYVILLEDAISTLGGTVGAIYLIDQHGSVQYANAAASRLSRDGRLTVRDGCLVAPDKVAMSQLQAAIAACLTDPEACGRI